MTQIALAESLINGAAWRRPARAARTVARPALTFETPRLMLRAAQPSSTEAVELKIVLKSTLSEIGWIRFGLDEKGDRAVNLSFFLAPTHRGRGLMREAARAAAPRALRVLDARMLRAMLPAEAPAAHNIARALGLAAMPGRGATRRFEKDLCGLL